MYCRGGGFRGAMSGRGGGYHYLRRMEAASEFTSKLGNRNGFRRSAPSERSGQILPSRNGRMDAIGSKGTTYRCYATLARLARRSAWGLARSSARGGRVGGGL